MAVTIKRRAPVTTPIEEVTIDGTGYVPNRSLTAMPWSPSRARPGSDLLITTRNAGTFAGDWSGTIADWREFAAGVEEMCREIEAKR